MADVKWIKLNTNMFEDEKIRLIEALPESDTILILWVKLLAQAGKTNATGYIYLNENIPYTDEMLATIFKRPLGTVRLALKTFEQFGMIDITDNHYISITNWEKHQNIDGLEKIRQQTQKRVAEHRKKKKVDLLEMPSNVTVTHGNATELELDIELELDKEKESNTTVEAETVFDFYQQNFGILSPFVAEDIQQWENDLNSELVIEAMKIAILSQKNWRYATGILKDWHKKGLKTLQDVRASEVEHEKQKQTKPSYSKKPARQEQLPDWFEDFQPTQQPTPQIDSDIEAKKQAIKDKLNQFRK
jgi:predicted phage replisome organizer